MEINSFPLSCTGVGGEVHIYNPASAELITKKIVFRGQKIHGFSSLQNGFVVVYGGRQCSIIEWNKVGR